MPGSMPASRCLFVLALLSTTPAAGQEALPTEPLEPGDRVRVVSVRPESAAAGPLQRSIVQREARFWLVDPARGLLVQVPGGERLYLREEDLLRIDRWRADPSAGMPARILGLGLGAYFGLTVEEYESPDGPGRLTIAGILLGGGLGWAIGHAIGADRGRWESIPVRVVFGLADPRGG